MHRETNNLIERKTKYEYTSIAIMALGGIIIGVCIIGAVLLIFGEEQEEQGTLLFKLSSIGFILLMIGIIIYMKSEKYKNIYKKDYIIPFVQKSLEEIFDSVVYQYDRGFSKQYINENIDLFGVRLPSNGHTIYLSCNYVCALYKGKSVRCCDVKIHYLFFGRILETEYPLPASAKLKIYTNNFPEVSELFPSKSEKIYKTYKESFDNEFQVRCDSEETFQNIITPEMMRKLVCFHNIYNVFAMEFFNNKLYVALETRRKTFALDYREKPDYDCQVAQIKMDVQFMKDVVDIFCRELC